MSWSGGCTIWAGPSGGSGPGAGKWDGRRYSMLARPRAAQLAAAPIPQTASAAARGPRTTVTRLWLCQVCYWMWPAADLFCGVCGRSRAAASDGREIQSLSEGR